MIAKTEVCDKIYKHGIIVRTKMSLLRGTLIIEEGMVDDSFIGGFNLQHHIEFDGEKLELLKRIIGCNQ